MAIKIRATRFGYYDMQVRHAGEEFEVRNEAAVSKVWMERVKSRPVDRDAEQADAPVSTGKGKREREQDKSKI